MSTFTDGDISAAQIAGVCQVDFPLELEDPTHYVVRQPMAVKASEYIGPPLNAKHPEFSAAYCVGDENKQLEGRVLRFDRVYATLPKSGDYWDSEMVTYPKYAGLPQGYEVLEPYPGALIIRYDYGEARNSVLSVDVAVRHRREYFIPGVIGGYDSPHDVEVLPKAQPFVDNVLDEADGYYAEWVARKMEVVVVPTKVERYMGNIWRSQTSFARAR